MPGAKTEPPNNPAKQPQPLTGTCNNSLFHLRMYYHHYFEVLPTSLDVS